MSQSEKVSLYSKVGQATEDGDKVHSLSWFKGTKTKGRTYKLLVSSATGTSRAVARVDRIVVSTRVHSPDSDVCV